MKELSIPGMDNPAWQYAAARHALYESGKSVELLACYELGEQIELTVQTQAGGQYEERTVSVTLKAMPEESSQNVLQ